MSRSILVTGSTGKIGRVFVRHFLSAGDTVIAAGRSASALENLRNEFPDFDGSLRTLCVDLMSPDAATTVIRDLSRIGCMPDGLINNARSLSHLRVGEDGSVDRQDFLNEFLLDVVAPYELVMGLTHAAGSRLRYVVNIASQYGLVAPNLRLYDDPQRQSPLQYGVAKAALVHLTKELAVRLADRGVRINCVAFGGIEGRVSDEFIKRYSVLCPIGRMLAEHELAGPVDMLLSDGASGVTGHTMVVDGGWSVW